MFQLRGLEICGGSMLRVIMNMKVKQIPLLLHNKLRWETDNVL